MYKVHGMAVATTLVVLASCGEYQPADYSTAPGASHPRATGDLKSRGAYWDEGRDRFTE